MRNWIIAAIALGALYFLAESKKPDPVPQEPPVVIEEERPRRNPVEQPADAPDAPF